jgi:hypothetical protein
MMKRGALEIFAKTKPDAPTKQEQEAWAAYSRWSLTIKLLPVVVCAFGVSAVVLFQVPLSLVGALFYVFMPLLAAFIMWICLKD